MRMKDQRLLAVYNVQHSTQGQYIINWTIAQSGSDNPALNAYLENGRALPRASRVGGSGSECWRGLWLGGKLRSIGKAGHQRLRPFALPVSEKYPSLVA